MIATPRYDHYFRIGDFDTWISSDGQFRAEKFIGGDIGYKVYTATFISTEEKKRQLINLTLRTKNSIFTFGFKEHKEKSYVEIKIPRTFLGFHLSTVIASGLLSNEQAKQLYSVLSGIPLQRIDQ